MLLAGSTIAIPLTCAPAGIVRTIGVFYPGDVRRRALPGLDWQARNGTRGAEREVTPKQGPLGGPRREPASIDGWIEFTQTGTMERKLRL